MPTQSFTGLSFPFRITPGFVGRPHVSSTGEGRTDHIAEGVHQLLGTSSDDRERWHLPDFGAAPTGLHWESMSDPVLGAYEARVRAAFAKYEQRVKIASLKLIPDPREGRLLAQVSVVVTATKQQIDGVLEV